MQDRANVSADFLELMKQEIIEVIKKYVEVDEKSIDVRLTNKSNDDGTNGAPALYANIPIVNIRNDMKKEIIKENKDEISVQQVEIKENDNEEVKKEKVQEKEEINVKEDDINNGENEDKTKDKIIEEKKEEENKNEINDMKESENKIVNEEKIEEGSKV